MRRRGDAVVPRSESRGRQVAGRPELGSLQVRATRKGNQTQPRHQLLQQVLVSDQI